MKNESQSRSKWLVFASLVMAFLLALSSVVSPQMVQVSYAKYATDENAGVLHLSVTHAHALLTTGFKLNRALATGTTTSGAPTVHTEITANTSLTEVYFGTPTEYASQISGITGVDVSYYGDKSIMLYKNGTKAYIVSDRTIATCDDFGSVFEKFTSLTKVHFSSDFDTSRAKTFAYLFFGASSIATIENLNTFNTSNATSMQSMFYTSSSSIKSLDVSSFNTSKVEDMGSIFRNCYNLESIDVSGFDTSNVWDMGGMFSECKQLETINLLNFNTAKAKTMQVMFSGCTSLKTLDLRSFTCESLTNMESMFSGCKNLKTIYADYDFDCRALSDPAATDEKNTSGNYDIDSNFANMFKGCEALVGGSGTTYDSDIVHNLRAVVDVNLAVEQTVFQSTKGYFTHYSGANEGSTFIMNGQNLNAAIKTLANGSSKKHSFTDTAIKKIYFGKTGDYNVSGLSSTNVDAAGNGTIKAYWNASTGTIYVLSNSTIVFSTSSDYMFAYMNSLTGIYFDNISTSAARTMQHMFAYCPSLSDLDLSKFETHNVVDYGSCFRGCAFNITTAHNNIIPYLDTAKARDIGGLFMHCTNLTGALNLSSLSSAKAETIASLVEGCTGITSVNISGFTVGSALSNTSNMFSGCTSLVTIHTNADFNLNVDQITNSGGMFTSCTNLVGGNGTKYNASYVGKTYARPDVTGTKGYFTSTSTYSLMSIALAMNEPEPTEEVSATDIIPTASASDITESTTTIAATTTTATTTTTEVAVTTTTVSEATTAATNTAVTSATDIASTTAATDATTASTTTGTSESGTDTTTATTAATVSTEATTATTTVTAEATTTTAATTTTTAASTTATVATTTTAVTTKATTTTTTTVAADSEA